MPERWLLVASRPAAPHTRTIWDDAAALRRTGHAVVVVATDDACTEAVLELPAVREALDLGVRVLVDAAAARRRHLTHRVPAERSVDDAGIATLLLDPGTRAVWR